jgi:hypothetical protein
MTTEISIKLAAFASLVFAAICLWFAVDAFTSLPDITDPDELSATKSFAWFWIFLGGFGVAIGLAAWWVARAQDAKDS